MDVDVFVCMRIARLLGEWGRYFVRECDYVLCMSVGVLGACDARFMYA